MKSNLLDTPLRLTWDIPINNRGLKRSDLLKVGGRIANADVFYVTLEGAPLSNPEIDSICNILQPAERKILVTCCGTKEELAAVPRLMDKIYRFHLDLYNYTSNSELDRRLLDHTLHYFQRLNIEPTLSLTPLRQNIPLIAEIINYCADHKISRFKLLNADIGVSFPKYSSDDLLRWEDLLEFRNRWVSYDLPETCPELEIHDRFLWEIMTPAEAKSRAVYGGCQAANSVGHIDIFGNIYPCAAWPKSLGSLLEDEIRDIWHSRQRLKVREQIASIPYECSSCNDWAVCFGGCRGLATFLGQGKESRDLMCQGPR